MPVNRNINAAAELQRALRAVREEAREIRYDDYLNEPNPGLEPDVEAEEIIEEDLRDDAEVVVDWGDAEVDGGNWDVPMDEGNPPLQGWPEPRDEDTRTHDGRTEEARVEVPAGAFTFATRPSVLKKRKTRKKKKGTMTNKEMISEFCYSNGGKYFEKWLMKQDIREWDKVARIILDIDNDNKNLDDNTRKLLDEQPTEGLKEWCRRYPYRPNEAAMIMFNSRERRTKVYSNILWDSYWKHGGSFHFN